MVRTFRIRENFTIARSINPFRIIYLIDGEVVRNGYFKESDKPDIKRLAIEWVTKGTINGEAITPRIPLKSFVRDGDLGQTNQRKRYTRRIKVTFWEYV